ncbi:MAG: T9SS C-terminal target domain-containing protein [Sphingobacteriales bacterium]|nr:MAG: T9SS C-terminal target domain-containing protein [Sphingobacteriales bacterium]
MKKLLTIFGIFLFSFSYAQLNVPIGTNFVVSSNTSLAVNNLLIKPNVAFNLAGFSVNKSTTAVPFGGNFSINNVYNFGNLVNNFTGEIGLFYKEAELNGNIANNLKIIYNNGTNDLQATNSVALTANNYVSNMFLSPQNIKSISAFSPSVLPISLLSFKVEKLNNKIKLNWISENEVNAAYYEIEHSIDGVNFNKLQKITASGNSQKEVIYHAYDNQPNIGLNYYMLNQFDFDGNKSFLGLKKVSFIINNNDYSISPNPFITFINIVSPFKISTIELININGKKVKQIKCNTQRYTLKTDNITAGVYILKISTEFENKFFKVTKF